jgi:hypothetical protein
MFNYQNQIPTMQGIGNQGYAGQSSMPCYSVDNIQAAALVRTPPNVPCILMDRNQAVFYIKTAGYAGDYSLRTFKFEEVLPNNGTNNGISQEEFTELKNSVNKIVESLGLKETNNG